MRDLEGRKLVIDLSSLTVIDREGEDAIVDLMKEAPDFPAPASRDVVRRFPGT